MRGFFWHKLLLQLVLCALAFAQCPITRQMVERTNRVFLSRGSNNQYALKRTETAAANEILHMFCRVGDIRQTRCRSTRVFDPALPMTCTNPPAATVQVVQAPGCRGTMYQVGHRVGNQFLELYRSCFDRSAVRTLYVDHRVYAKTFFPTRPCVRFSGDGVLTNADEASYTARNIHATFRRLFGNNNRYVPNDRNVVINRGHLAASADFLFGDQMCATFKYVNVVPQFLSINDRNWEAIERWVRGQVRGTDYVNVRTGAVGVLSLPDSRNRNKPVILNGARNPVPEWMYKIVRSSNNSRTTIFLTYNNIFARSRPRAPRFCTPVNCPLVLRNNARAGFTYCCNPRNFNP